MTPGDKQIAIAKIFGWKFHNGEPTWLHGRPPPLGVREPLDYLNDLNAMHSAEMGINDPDKWDRYYDSLDTICEASEIDARSATAAQRADALLLTLG